MNNKRPLERPPLIHIQPPPEPENGGGYGGIVSPAEAYERACEDRAVQMGIMTDRTTYLTVPSPLPASVSDDDHVWLFVPARTSKRSIRHLAETCGSPIVRFFVRVRCLSKYMFSGKFDVAYHLNDEGRYFLLPTGTFADLQVHVVNPEQNPAVLELVRALRVVPHGLAATPDA